MKHIKTYKLFESLHHWRNSMSKDALSDIQYLEDIGQDLRDKGYRVWVNPHHTQPNGSKALVVNFDKLSPKTHNLRPIPVLHKNINGNQIKYKDIKETIDMMISYMESEGYTAFSSYMIITKNQLDFLKIQPPAPKLWSESTHEMSSLKYKIIFCKE